MNSSGMRWAGRVALMGEMRSLCKILAAKRQGKMPVGRPKRIWKDNIKMDLQGVGMEGCGLD
jgi:hypothetical protein